MSLCCARQPENQEKNRYRDVLPCKCSTPRLHAMLVLFSAPGSSVKFNSRQPCSDPHLLLSCSVSDDETRVVLQGKDDYINASHITVNITHLKTVSSPCSPLSLNSPCVHLVCVCMCVSQVAPPESGVCLRYIAAQGPLPQTCTHFWQTVWEQQTHTIIMLTTLTERGRVYHAFSFVFTSRETAFFLQKHLKIMQLNVSDALM